MILDENTATISCKIKFIDSTRFMASSLSNHVENLVERIHKIRFKDYDCIFGYESVNGDLIKTYLVSILIILKLLLNIQMLWMILIKILRNTIQINNVKY